jgi:hypothetical protein
VRNDSGEQLARAPREKPVLETSVYAIDEHEIDQRIAQIISENAAQPVRTALVRQVRHGR